MSPKHRLSGLAQEISGIIDGMGARRDRPRAGTPVSRSVVYGSMAALAIAPSQVGAVALGDIRLNSALGQPLRATVPLNLARGETLRPDCVTIPSRGSGELAGPRKPALRLPAADQAGRYEMQISTQTPLYEPMYELSVRVECPGAPLLVRQYVLMLDLPGMAAAPEPVASSFPGETRPAAPQSAARSAPARDARPDRPLAPVTGRIPAGSVYRIREGDNLSMIASKVDGRPANSTWTVANLIFRMNPDAFIRGNPDLIKMGWQIRIPDERDWSQPVADLIRSRPAPAVPAPLPAPGVMRTGEATPAIRPEPETARAAPVAPPVENSMPVSPAEDTPPAQPTVPEETPVSPFADEQPGARSAAPVTAGEIPASTMAGTDPAEPEAPDEAVPATDEPSSEVSPLIAIGFGVLLGLILSVLLLRSRFLEKLSLLFGRRRSQAAQEAQFSNTDEMFATDPSVETPEEDAPAVAVQHLQAQDYVVETEEPDGAEAPVPAPEAADEPTVVASMNTAASDDSGAGDDGTLLDILFEEREENLTQELPMDVAEIFAGEEDGGDDDTTGPVEKTPGGDARPETLEPTAEMPEVGSDADALTVSTEAYPADGGDLAATEIAKPAFDEEPPTEELDLEKLAEAAGEDESLSTTLMEALSLLERDYEDEMTASQIVDREAIEKALDKGREDKDDEDTANMEQEKIT